MNYLIAGLPRSKTAWMSVVASSCVAESMCYHEPIVKFGKWECCFDIWKSNRYRYIGVSDSSLAFQFERIIAEANPRILVIRRSLDEVKASLAALRGPQTNYPDLLFSKLEGYLAHPNVAWVDFHALKYPAPVIQCLNHLMPGAAINAEKVGELLNMNIQVEMERIWDFAMNGRCAIDSLLGPEAMAGLTLFQ